MARNKKDLARFNRIRNRSKRTARNHPERPRICVFRSNKHIEVQIIDDSKGVTLVSASSKEKILSTQITKAKSKIEKSQIVGKVLAERAVKSKIKEVVLDRNGFSYRGRVKALADAARENGLAF